MTPINESKRLNTFLQKYSDFIRILRRIIIQFLFSRIVIYFDLNP